jgi:hypothetical protein
LASGKPDVCLAPKVGSGYPRGTPILNGDIMAQTPQILIGTPCYGGMVTHVYMQSLLKLMSYAASHGMGFNLALLAHDSLITRSRNTIFANFLDTPSATHLMFIDSDIAFEPEAVERLVRFDAEIAAGMYPVKVIHWPQVRQRAVEAVSSAALSRTGLNYVGVVCEEAEREERDGFVTGTYAGTGFMLIKRSAAEKMIAAYPETKYKSIQTYPVPKNPSPNQYNLFDCTIDPETGTYLSEDFTFCRRWRQCGGQLWLDRQSKLTHVGSYEFEGDAGTAL